MVEITNIIELEQLLRDKFNEDILSVPSNHRKLYLAIFFRDHKIRQREIIKIYQDICQYSKNSNECIQALCQFWGMSYRQIWHLISKNVGKNKVIVSIE